MEDHGNVVGFKDQAYAVRTQVPSLDENSLAEARRLIGVDYRWAQSTIEITRDAIADFCNYMGSSNPLFLDERYARKTRWAGIIAPPAMVGQAIIAPGLRGIQWIYAGSEWEFFQPMRPGDVIAQRGKLIDAAARSGRTVPYMILQTGEVLCTNQHGELVARTNVHCMRTPRRQAGGGMSYQPRGKKWTPEELLALEDAQAKEVIRGGTPRYWEDVSEGEPTDTVHYGPLRVTDIGFTGSYTESATMMAEGTAHIGAHGYQLAHRRRHPADTYFDPVTGTEDHPHRGHWEGFMAQEVGMPGIYDMGPHRLTWLCRYVTDWMGDDASLKKLGGWLRRPNLVGDVTRINGSVKRKWIEINQHLVELEIVAENQEGEVTMPGYAVVDLPSRTVAEERS